DHGHAGRIALADPVAVVLAFLLRLLALDEGLRGLALELRIRRARAPGVEATAQVDEPRARQIERGLRPRLLEVRRRERTRLGRRSGGLRQRRLRGKRGERQDERNSSDTTPADHVPSGRHFRLTWRSGAASTDRSRSLRPERR